MPTPERVHEYYVLNPEIQNEVGGHRIMLRGKDRIVVMLPSQADYWIDQGALGDKPGEVQSVLGRISGRHRAKDKSAVG